MSTLLLTFLLNGEWRFSLRSQLENLDVMLIICEVRIAIKTPVGYTREVHGSTSTTAREAIFPENLSTDCLQVEDTSFLLERRGAEIYFPTE